MHPTPRVPALVLLAIVLGEVGAAGAETAIEKANKALYLRYCGSCHGPDGKGDGVASSFLTPKPTDLTQLGKKNGGQFPFEQTMRAIDGRNTPRAHGDPAMPVWGDIFQAQAGWSSTQRAEIEGRLFLITEYIRSIQQR